MVQSPHLRPSPDALLKLAGREARGKLKVFLGASPGVGKTYAMLSGARRLKAEGRDVMVGLVETHGRSDTAALLEGLEVLPRRPVAYKGRTLMEFDVDAALARRPDLIIVDELAHTNAPDSRHPKRFQDVEELLTAGIDVWTALNIQHVESLSDVVAGITGITIREVVPDTVIERADDVVVVDVTPDELLERLRDGKVYLPDNARRAADNFFKPGNLTALRELALRRTADRVDDEMVDFLRQNAIEGPWPTAERILVCVGPDAQSQAVVRVAGRLAKGLNAGWVAAHLDRIGRDGRDPEALKRVEEALKLAQRLGADISRLSARDLPTEVLRYARRENITQIVLGRSRASWFKRFIGRSLSDEITRQAEGIAVHIVTPPKGKAPSFQWPRPVMAASAYIGAFVAVAIATGLGLFAIQWLQAPAISMFFLAAVLLCANRFGTSSAIVAALLSFLAYNFFFIAPLHTLTVASPHELLALTVFLLVAVITGSLSGRVREQSVAAGRRIFQTQMLFDFSRKLSGTAALDDVLWAVASQTASAIKGESIVLLGENGELEIKAAFPPEDIMGPGEWTAARWALNHREAAGLGTTTLPNAHFTFRPLATPRGIVGVIGLRPGARDVSGEDQRVIEALIDQTTVAIERTLLAVDAAKAEAMAESERLRSALLSSISHDLRTPLATILGAVTSLRSLGGQMPKESQSELLSAIEEETRRMSQFVTNLLDMTRLEAPNLEIGRDWVDLADVIRAAVTRARSTWPERRIELAIAAGLPLVHGDSGLLEQVVFNLLDNAHKYSPAGSPTKVGAAARLGEILIEVSDEGQGIPPDDLERVFDKFYRAKQGDGRSAGVGLGLAICRGIVSALGGSITAASPIADGRGTRITIRLPVPRQTV
ncbi:sensor histidine kinase KdpD [Nordella sp. HKS 07]|uniref:sensor histidine kinase n=1 Tax=Nordella sp. HKS 07 TaxID=2712222 RepID=UPI0013E0F991|nr:sensor histidine kinase KdpD [Nordella sp. HKS 07]QIG52223.1 sensor histidine kinase KdpD [Nordella sp. HKS 07]